MVVVSASVSGSEIAVDIVKPAKIPVHAVVNRHAAHRYFGDQAFDHPKIQKEPSIANASGQTFYLAYGKIIPDVDHINFGTGYS